MKRLTKPEWKLIKQNRKSIDKIEECTCCSFTNIYKRQESPHITRYKRKLKEKCQLQKKGHKLLPSEVKRGQKQIP